MLLYEVQCILSIPIRISYRLLSFTNPGSAVMHARHFGIESRLALSPFGDCKSQRTGKMHLGNLSHVLEKQACPSFPRSKHPGEVS